MSTLLFIIGALFLAVICVSIVDPWQSPDAVADEEERRELIIEALARSAF